MTPFVCILFMNMVNKPFFNFQFLLSEVIIITIKFITIIVYQSIIYII